MPASSLFDQLREQSRPSFEPEPLDTGTITKNVDTRLAKEAADYQKGQDQAAKDASKQQVQGLRDKGYTVTHDETGAAKPLTAPNGEPVRRKLGSRIHVGEQTGNYYEPDLQKGGLKPAVGQTKTDKSGRIVEDFGGGLTKDHGEDPVWAKQKEDKTLLTKAEAAIRDKMLTPPPDNLDVVKVKKDYGSAQKKLIEANKNLEIDKTSPDYISARDAAQAEVDKLKPQNDKINEWSRAKQGLKGNLAQINTHRKLLGEGAFTDEHRKQWQSVIAPPAAPAPATVTPAAPTAGSSGQAALQASKEPMSESPTAAPAAGTVATPTRTQAPSPAVSPVQGQGTVAPSVVSPVSSPQPITPAPREQLVTPEAVADLSVADHNTAIQASDAALKQNAAAIQQKQDAINAPVAAVDAKLSAWQAKSQAALAAGDAAISMMQPDGTMSPLFAASTKKELQDLYLERQKAQTAIAPQLEELDGEFAAHGEDVDAHNRAIENLNGKIESAKAEQETKRQESLKALRSQPETAPIADKIDALDKETESARAQIDAKEWDDSSKEAALGALEADREAKMKDINKVLNRGSIMGLAQRIYANTTDAEKKKQAERSSLKNYDSEGGYSGPSEKELADTYDSPVNAKVASALNHAGLSSDEIKPYLEDVKNLDFGRNQKESALLSDGNLAVNPKNYLREDDYKTAVEASGATEEQKKAALDRFPKLQQKAAADLYSSIQETDPALLKREVDVMPGETDADKMTAYMNRGYLPRLWTQIRAELGANISGLQKGVLGIAAAVAGATDKGYKALGLPDLATGEISDYLHEKALGFAKDQQSDSQVAGLMKTGVAGTAISKLVGFVPDFAAMGAVGRVGQSIRFLTGAGSETIAGIDAATAATRAAAATRDVKKGKEAYGQLLKAQGATDEVMTEKLIALKDKLAPFGASPLPGDVLVAMEEVGGKKLSGLVAKEAGTGANAAAAYFAGKGGGETYVDAYDKTFRTLTEKGVNPDAAKSQAQASALVPALVNGAITYALFKNKSLGDITDNALETEAMLKRTMSDVLKSIGQHAAIDAGKLGLDTLAHGIVAKATYDPEKSPASILEESLQSALTGALMGGVIRAVHEFAIRKSGGKAAGEKPTDTEPQSPNPDVPPNPPGGLPVEVKTAASDAELKANPNGGDPEKAFVLRDIATGANVATMTEGELNAVGLTHKGDKVVPITGKDAPTPAVQVTGDGKAIILQPALDELRATFPATAEFVTMDEKQAREKFAQNGNTDTSGKEPVVENAVPPTPTVAAEPRVEPSPSGEGAAKAVAKGQKIEGKTYGDTFGPPPFEAPESSKAYVVQRKAEGATAQEAAEEIRQARENYLIKTEAALPTGSIIKLPDGSRHERQTDGSWRALDRGDDNTRGQGVVLKRHVGSDFEIVRVGHKGESGNRGTEKGDPTPIKEPVKSTPNPAALERAADLVAKAGDTELAAKIRENAAPPTVEVAPEPRVEPTPSGEVAAKPVVPNPAAVAKVADIAATFGKQSATNIQEKLSPLHPKVTKVIDGMISAYGKRGVKIIKGKSDATSGIEYDALTKVITLDLPKIQANTEGSTPNDTIAWVRDSVARHELVHLISTTDKTVAGHLDELWSQLTPEDKSASAKTYYKGSRDQWDSDFRGKHEFMVQLVQAAEDGKLEPALLKILKGNSKSLFNTLRQLMDALIARLQRILTDPKHKAHEAAKKTLEAFKAARARLFAEPVGKVDTTSGLRDLGESEGDATTGLSRKTTNPAEGGQSKSGVGNRPAASNEAPDASSFASGVASKVADSGDVATVDVKAHEAAASPHNDLTPPTPAQIEADNYKVGKVRLAGEDISIETPAGAKRREEWPALKDHYGRILGTKGADGELLDIFIKEGTPLDWNGPVFVVNQNKPDGTFDETKAIAGAKSVAEARDIYKRNYSKGWKGLGGIVKFDSLKQWVESDHSGKAKKPVDVKPVNVKTGGMEIITPPAPPQPKAEVVQPPAPPQPHPANVDIPSDIATRKEIVSLVKLKHRRSTEDESRLIELGKQHLKYVREVLNIERVDGLGDTDMMVGASLDKGESTNDKRHSASDQRILRALSQPESTPALIAEVRDTLFELPPRARSLSGMRDAVRKRLDVLERQQEEGNFPADKSRGVRADDWKIVERDGKFIIQEKVTGEEDLGFPTYDTLAEAEAKVKSENDANTLDNRTTVDGEDKLRERINTLRALLGRIEAKMSGIKDTSEVQREEQRRTLSTKSTVPPRPMNMAGETRPVRTKTTAPAFDTLPTKSQEKFNAAFTSKDADGMNALLHPGNKGLRAEFERRTGTKLPAGVGSTKAAVEAWAGPQESPLMKSWRALRAELPADTVIAFRLGDFYEFFSDDAKFVAPALNIALTKRNNIEMAGVPHHAATKYFQQLTQAGKKVAVVEQSEDGKRAVVDTIKASETPEKPTVAPEIAPVIERPYGPPDETGKSGTETREGKNPNEAKAPELMTPSEEPPTSNEQPSNPPTPATTPAEGQSTGGVVEGEKAPTAQEWKALHEEHQALLKASKNDPQAWKPKEWQAHRADLMKREAESRKVPSIWTHNELVTTKGKYEIDHETGELTKLQDLSETGFIRNVDSMFKDGIPESGIDGGNNLAREMWDKVKAERAEAAQRKADAIAEAEAAAKVKAEEQVKLDAEQKAKFADYEASVPKVKFEPATLEVELMGGPTKLNGYRSGDWFIEIRLSKYNGPRVWYVPTKQKLPDSLALRNQTEAKDLVTKVANANKGFNGDFAKDEPQRLKILDTLKAWKDGVAPAWFTTTPAASPKETSPKKGDLATISLGGREYPKTRILNVVETPEGTRYQVDVFGPKFVSRADVVKVERQVAKVAAPVAATPQLIRQLGDIAVKNRQPVSEEYIDAVGGRIPEGYALKDGSYQAKEPETDKPPASSDVVKPPKLQSPSITPEQDAEYMKAADSGDTETAQRMVDEAAGPRIAKRAAILRNIASKSYPNVKLIGGNGDFGDDVESVFSESGVYVSGVREPLFAYVIDGEVVGGVMADTDGDFMFDLAVKERFRGRGIGRELISRTIKYFIKNRSRLAAEQGLETSSYDMIGLPTNAAARSLNLSVGMEHSREESSITGEFLDSIDPVTRDESGNVIPLSQRFTPSNDIRFSLAPRSQQDTEYLAAVEAGDTETAQRMVNEAARGAALGGALPVDLAQGIYLHWDGENRVTVVQKDRRGVDEIGMFEGYLPKTDDRPAHFLMFALNPNKQGRGIGPLAIKALANMGELMVDSTERDMRSSLSKIDAKQTGEDEFKIKSADPITRRPDGSIIPLSERFNPASPTPLQTQSPDSDEYWSYNTVVKWMTDNGIPVDMTREEYEGEVARRKGIIEPPVHDTTQAGTAQMREQGGYEEYIKNEPRSFREKVWPEALQIVSKEPFKGTELVKELLDSPRALEDTERAILTHESLRRQKAYDKSIDDLIAAKPEDYAAAEKKMMAAREAHQEGLEALDMAGSKAGSALGAIRLMIKNDFSLGRLERRFRAALGPKPTPEEIKEADAKAAELAKVIKENDELTEQIRSQLDEIAGLKAAMKAHEHGLTPKADRKAEIKEEIKEEDEALARLKARRKLGAPGVGSAPMFQATREPFDGTTRVPSYFATSEDYAKNFGEHIRPVAIYPKNTLDLTDIEGSDEEGGKKLKTALQAKGISIDGLNISSDDELPQALMRNLKELSLRIKAAGFDTVRISEYTLNGGADQTVLVVDKSALSSSDVLASPSPEDDDFNNLVIFGRRFIRDGAPDLASFTTAFNEALPGALGDNASAVYEAAKVKFKEAEDAALKDSTPTGVTNKIKGKRAEITDLKADDLNRLALSIVQHEGVKDVDTLRSRMHEHLEEIFPHITERDVSKAWTGFEKAIYPSEDPFRKTVSDLRAQEQLILKAQTLLEEERLALKSGRQPPPRTDAQRKLIRDYNELVKASGLTTSDPVTQLASTQSRIVKALENRKADLEAQVAAKKREVRANVTTEETPEMKRLRKEIAALNAKLDILDPRNTGPTEAQKIKISENALKKSIENVDKEIAELERKVKNNDLSESVPATKTPVTSPTIAQRRKELAAKREQRDELANQLDDLREAAKPVVDPVMKVLGKWEERQNLATVKAPPRTKSRLEELSKRYLDSESPRFVQDAVALGMSLGDAEYAKLILDAERNRREEIALASMRRRVRRNIERQVARAQAFDEDSPLARKTPAEKKLDKDLTEAEFQLSLAKREALRAEEKFRLRNRTPLRKAADFAVKWRRALILADYVVLYKLGMAAGWRMAFTPTEEVIGAGISKAIPGLSKNAPREFGGSVRAEAEALTQGFRYFVENFGKVLKHGVSSMDTKYSSKPDFNDLDPSLSDYIGNSHAAIKLLPKASEFYRSFRKRTEAALRNGIDATSPAAVQAIGAAAYLDAQRAIFMNPNFVSEGWRAIIGKLRKTETSPNWAKATADVMEAAIPIVKVPTNILFEALGSYIGGILRETPFALKSAAKAATTFDGQGFAKRFNDEYSKLPPEQAEAVLRHLKKGAFGNALMLLVMLTGATAAKLIGGLWTPDDKREPWQVKPERLRLTEDSKDLPRWIAHNPVFDTLHFAVTAYHYAEKAANASKAIAAKAEVEIAEAEHRMKKANGSSKDFIKAQQEREVARKKLEVARSAGDPNKLAWAMATLSGMTTSTLALVEKAPLIGNVGQFLDAIPEDKKGDYLKKELAASAIPTGVTNIAKGEDEGADGEPIKRKMESFSDHLKNRIPGLRQTLPFKNGETDEFGFKRSETHVPIPGEKAIENFNKKNPDVKYHIPKISQASLDDLPNEVAKTAFQIRAGELLRKYSKEGIVKSEVVNDGSRKEPNFVIKKTVEIPPITKEESENPTLKTIEKLKSMHRKAVTTAKSDAERPDWPLSYLDKYRSSVTK